MTVDETESPGALPPAPFARILAGIGQQGRTGLLLVRAPWGEKKFSFNRGDLALESGSLDEQGFLRFLWTSGLADLIALARVEDHARRNGLSLLRALTDTALVEPARLWPALEAFVKDEVLSLFDREDAEFEFRDLAALSGRILLRGIDLAGLILDGVRKMTNTALFIGHLPGEGELIRRLQPDWPERPGLALHERYLLGLLDDGATLADLYAAGDIGKEEIQRTLFAFLCLGLVGTAAPKPKTARLAAEHSPADMDRLFALFNNRCSYIFKYISKGIGPVALSIIEKSLDEVKARLDPAFQGLELTPDGRIELKSPLRINLTLGGEEGRRSLLRSMDEILMAEVLAVKRTLGPAHEAALVKSLEKMGESP